MDPVVIFKNVTISHNGIETLSNIILKSKRRVYLFYRKDWVGKAVY